MDGKEKVKDFNQCFINLRNKIPVESRPTKGVVTKFYTSALLQTMAMFVKQAQNTTFQGNFAEAIRVKKDLSSLKVNQGDDKPSTSRAPVKTHTDRREQDSFNIEGLQRMVKQLSNEIIDLKKNSGKSTSRRAFFRFPNKKHFPPRHHPPPENINIQDYAIDNLCQAHKDNHSKKNFPTLINMFELFTMSQTNPPPSEENRNAENHEDPTDELLINHFWDLCDLFEGEEESSLEEIKTAQHSHHTRSKWVVTQSSPSISNNIGDTPGCSQKNNVSDKAVTTNVTVNKNHHL